MRKYGSCKKVVLALFLPFSKTFFNSFWMCWLCASSYVGIGHSLTDGPYFFVLCKIACAKNMRHLGIFSKSLLLRYTKFLHMRAFTSSQLVIVIRLKLCDIKSHAHTHMQTIPPHQAMYVFFLGESSHVWQSQVKFSALQFFVMNDRRVERLEQKYIVQASHVC